jgi:hypothetical protein
MIFSTPRNNSALPGATDAMLGMSLRYEKKRRIVVAFVYAIFLLWILEGILRKWIFPAESRLLYFIRDPFVIALYLYAVSTGLWPRRYVILNAALVLAVSVLALAGIQLFTGYGIESAISPVIFALYGWRNFFLYIPLAFIIGEHFRAQDMAKFQNSTILLGILSSVLVYMQFHAPINSAINVGSSDDVALQFIGLGLDETHTRPMGAFTSVTGQSTFVSLLSAFSIISLAGITGTRGMTRDRVIGMFGLIGTLGCVAYSGSRGELLSLSVALLISIFLIVFYGTKENRNRIVKISVVALVIGMGLGLTWFRAGIEALIQRWTSAYSTESQIFSGGIFGRSLYGFIDFGRLVFETPLTGLGLGSAGNASTLLGATYHNVVPLAIAETEWSRHIFEVGPIAGIILIVFRVTVFVWLLKKVIASPTIAATILFGTVALTELYGSIATHGSANVFGWLTVGFCLAAVRTGTPEQSKLIDANAPRKFQNVLGVSPQ